MQALQQEQSSLLKSTSRAKQEASAACKLEAEAQTGLRQTGARCVHAQH